MSDGIVVDSLFVCQRLKLGSNTAANVAQIDRSAACYTIGWVWYGGMIGISLFLGGSKV
jgi:hypothetical protein